MKTPKSKASVVAPPGKPLRREPLVPISVETLIETFQEIQRLGKVESLQAFFEGKGLEINVKFEVIEAFQTFSANESLHPRSELVAMIARAPGTRTDPATGCGNQRLPKPPIEIA